MKNLITSASGKKEAQILFSTYSGKYRATLFLLGHDGIAPFADYWQSKEFATLERATKWAITTIN